MLSFNPVATPLRPPFTSTNSIKVSMAGTIAAVSHDYEHDLIVLLSYDTTVDILRYLGDLTPVNTYTLPASAGNAGGAYLAYCGSCVAALRAHYVSQSSTRTIPPGSTNNVEIHQYDSNTNSYTKFTTSFFPGNPAAPFTSASFNCEKINCMETEDGTKLILVSVASYDGLYNGKQVTSRSFVRVFKFNGTAITYVQDIVDSVPHPSNLTYSSASDAYSSPAVRAFNYDNISDHVVISSAVYLGSPGAGYNARAMAYKWNGTSLVAVSSLSTYAGVFDGFTLITNARGTFGITKIQPSTFPGTLSYRVYKIVGNTWTLVDTLAKSVSYQANNTEFTSNDISLFVSSEASTVLSDLELYLHVYEVDAADKIVLRRVINRHHLGIPLTNTVTIKRIPYLDFIDSEIFVCCHQYRAPGDTGFDLVKLSQAPI